MGRLRGWPPRPGQQPRPAAPLVILVLRMHRVPIWISKRFTKSGRSPRTNFACARLNYRHDKTADTSTAYLTGHVDTLPVTSAVLAGILLN